MFEYPIELKKGNGVFYVTFPDVPEAHTLGDTKEEALAYAVEALEAGLSFYVDEGKPLPKPSAKRGRLTVDPTVKGAMKLGIYQAMKKSGLRKADLARRLKCHPIQVDRLLDLTHSSRIELLEEAFAVLGHRVHLEMEAA